MVRESPHPIMENGDENSGMEIGDAVPQVNHARPSGDYYPTPEYPALEPDTPSYHDWNYNARRTSQEILPGLFLGPYASATRAAREEMLKMGLTHVVCVRSAAEAPFIRPNHTDDFRYLVVEVNDSIFEGIIPKVKVVIQFLDECFKAGGRALVHGNGGMCRSAAIVIGYIMWTHGVDMQTAFNFVQHKRFCIGLNDAFTSQLRDFQMMVQAIHVVPPNSENNPNKRTLEEDEDQPPEKFVVRPTDPRQ